MIKKKALLVAAAAAGGITIAALIFASKKTTPPGVVPSEVILSPPPGVSSPTTITPSPPGVMPPSTQPPPVLLPIAVAPPSGAPGTPYTPVLVTPMGTPPPPPPPASPQPFSWNIEVDVFLNDIDSTTGLATRKPFPGASVSIVVVPASTYNVGQTVVSPTQLTNGNVSGATDANGVFMVTLSGVIGTLSVPYDTGIPDPNNPGNDLYACCKVVLDGLEVQGRVSPNYVAGKLNPVPVSRPAGFILQPQTTGQMKAVVEVYSAALIASMA